MNRNGLDHPGHRQADDVLKGSLDPFDETPPVLLGRIGTRLVRGIDVREVGGDFAGIQRPEADPGRLHEAAPGNAPAPHQADSGEHLVSAAAEQFQHPDRMGHVPGLSENFSVEHHDSVGTEDQISPAALQRGDGAGLEVGIGEDKLPGKESPGEFLGISRLNHDIETGR